MSETPLKTPLYETHLSFGARMVEFAGWQMPLQYVGINAEHVHTRTACSLFDVSHMGRLKLTGDDAEPLLDRLCTRNLAGAEVGRSYYSHMCREDGGILDDMIVSRFESHWGVVCNAANRGKILGWINRHSTGMDVQVADETMNTAMIAVQGPKTLEVAADLVDEDLASIKRYRFRVFPVVGMSIVVYRSGYTGEDGFEVVVGASLVGLLLPRLLGTSKQPHPVVRPAGLGARDTLRIEAAMPLYGHELTEEVDSLTAGQAWCVDLNTDFIGAEAMRSLSAEGLPRRLVGLELEGRRIARQHAGVYVSQGTPLAKDREWGPQQRVGEITSGTLSPTLGRSIAMGFVTHEYTAEGTALHVEVGRERAAAKVVKLPFYKRAKEQVT